jgi:DNA gyrase subunit B
MYIGHEWDTTGLHFLILEIIRLAVHPDSANESTALNVTIKSDRALLLEDNGRGLPVGIVQLWRNSRVVGPKIELVLTMIFERHPGRQYHEEFGFLDYLGAVLNAISARLEIETHINEECYRLMCSRGEIGQNLYKAGPSNTHGTRITFWPDPEVFKGISFDSKIISAGLSQFSSQYPHVRFSFRDERAGQTMERF